MSYFVGILSEVGNILLLGCPQVFSNFKDISELYKSLTQRGEFSYK